MQREIIDPYYHSTSDVVLTCYFTLKRDPQAGASPNHKDYVNKNSFDYIYPWYLTMKDQGLYGIIFYDKLNEEFIEKYQTDKIKFVRVQLGPYSTNDERFYIYKKYLENSQCKYKKVLMTDVSDVFIKRNPFDLIEKDDLYIGEDMPQTPLLGNNPWCVNKANQLISEGKGNLIIEQDFAKVKLLNAGVIGGKVREIKRFLTAMCTVFDILESKNNNNMMTMHYVLYKNNFAVTSGYPLTSKFKQYEYNTEAYIIHK